MKLLYIASGVVLGLLSVPHLRGKSPQVADEPIQRFASSESCEVLYEQDFDDLAGSLNDGDKHHGFWFEGAAGGATAQFANGRLELKANRRDGKVGTLWLDRVFEGNLKIEFDAQVTASTGEKNNINFFLLFSDKRGTPIYDTRLERSDGGYKHYHGGKDSDHPLTGTIFTHLANGSPSNPRFRLRSVPPFDPVLHEVNGVSDVEIGKTYHIEIEKTGQQIAYTVNGTLIFKAPLGSPAGKKKVAGNRGLIGFRTWSTDLWWDSLRVTRLSDLKD